MVAEPRADRFFSAKPAIKSVITRALACFKLPTLQPESLLQRIGELDRLPNAADGGSLALVGAAK